MGWVSSGLVAGDGGVDGAGPEVDASVEGLGVVEALVAEPHGDGKGAGPVVAEDDDGLVGIELGVGAGGDFAHRHQESAGDAGCFGFPGLADVEEQGWGGFGTLLEVGLGSDFWIAHCFRVQGTGCSPTVPCAGCGEQFEWDAALEESLRLFRVWLPVVSTLEDSLHPTSTGPV